jgi:membrane-associated phospholipid phosphatase
VLLRNDEESGLNAVDTLNFLALLLLGVLVALFRRDLGQEAFWLLGMFALLMAFVLASAALGVHHPLWHAVHAFSPALVIPVIFNTLGPIIDCANPVRWDTTFSALDTRLAGTLPGFWRGVLGRPSWFVDLNSVAYVSYYLVPVVVAVVLYRRRASDQFTRLVFTITFTFYASYVGYFIFPAVGPRLPPQAEPLLAGGAISEGVRVFVEFAERTRADAFPSGHTAVALVCLLFAWSASKRLFAGLVPLVAGIVFSTVYLHYHYVIDVVAAGALAVACGWSGPRLESLLRPREMRRRVAMHLGIH